MLQMHLLFDSYHYSEKVYSLQSLNANSVRIDTSTNVSGVAISPNDLTGVSVDMEEKEVGLMQKKLNISFVPANINFIRVTFHFELNQMTLVQSPPA